MKFSRRFFWLLLLLSVTGALYLPSLGAEFVYDDQLDVLENPKIHSLSNASGYLSLKEMARGSYDSVRPVYVLTVMLDWALWGPQPFGFHLTNLLLHLGNALLLFLLCERLLRLYRPEHSFWAAPCAGLGALFFAIHPAASEAILPVTFRKDLLAAFFTLLGLNALAIVPAAAGLKKKLLGAAAALAFLLALGSKENGIAGPYAAFLCCWLFFRKKIRKDLAGILVAIFALTHAFFLLRLLAPADSDTAASQYLGGSLSAALAIQPRIWAYQLGQIFFPWIGFCADPLQLALGTIGATAGRLYVGAALALALWLARKNKVMLFGLALYALALLPASNLFPLYQVMADRFLYFPLTGMGIFASALLFDVLPGLDLRAKLACLLCGLAAAAGLSVQTLDRQRAWHDEMSLWTDTLAKNPASLNGLFGLGWAITEKGDYAQAAALYRQAVKRTDGQSADAWIGLACSLDNLQQAAEAKQAFERTVALDRRYLEPEKNSRALHLTQRDVKDVRKLLDRLQKDWKNR